MTLKIGVSLQKHQEPPRTGQGSMLWKDQPRASREATKNEHASINKRKVIFERPTMNINHHHS